MLCNLLACRLVGVTSKCENAVSSFFFFFSFYSIFFLGLRGVGALNLRIFGSQLGDLLLFNLFFSTASWLLALNGVCKVRANLAGLLWLRFSVNVNVDMALDVDVDGCGCALCHPLALWPLVSASTRICAHMEVHSRCTQKKRRSLACCRSTKLVFCILQALFLSFQKFYNHNCCLDEFHLSVYHDPIFRTLVINKYVYWNWYLLSINELYLFGILQGEV